MQAFGEAQNEAKDDPRESWTEDDDGAAVWTLNKSDQPQSSKVCAVVPKSDSESCKMQQSTSAKVQRAQRQ